MVLVWRRRQGHVGVQRKLATTGVITLAGCLCLGMAACDLTPGASQGPVLPVIQTPAGSLTPTPEPLTYTAGAWPSNSSPLANSYITIYVSFTHEGTPVAGAQVTVQVYYPAHAGTAARQSAYGPATTNSAGLVALRVPAGGALNVAGKTSRTAQVTALVTYGGESYTCSTNFTPLP